MSNDDICPRCDQRLEAAPSPNGEAADSTGGSAVDSATPDDLAEQPPGPASMPPRDDSPAKQVAGEDVRDLPTELEFGRVVAEVDKAADTSSADAPAAPVEAGPEADAGPVSSTASTTARHTTRAQPDADEAAAADPGGEPGEDDALDMTHPVVHQPPETVYHIPPAPYTPPPVQAYVTSSYGIPEPHLVPSSAADTQAAGFIQQRVDLYRRGGYRLRSNRPHEAILTCGKRLGVGGWMLALLSLVGLFWYLLLLVLSGFQSDTVYIVLESDGFVYEDGPGAAHTRRHRMAVGRRWAMFGVLLSVVSVVLGIALGIVAGAVLTQERYQAALREAYPAVTLFEEQFSDAQAAPDDVALAKDGAVAFAILAGIAGVGLWGGLTLFVIGTIHAGAYRVKVPPLPGWG